MAIALMKMFWKSMYMPSKINTILEKEDVTLDEVLAEDDVVDECKSSNSKLLDFLTRSENLERLVNMMVDEPDSEVEEKLKYKNAHQACEILTSDSSQITDALADRVDLLSKIYSFFEKDPPINPLQASFFSKTMGLLITHKSEKMLNFFKSHDDFTKRLVSHLDTSAIADLLLRLVTCIDSVQCRNQCFRWLHEQDLVKHLVSLMDANKSNEVHSNASQSICDIIRLSREHQYQHAQQHSVTNGGDPAVAPDDVLLKAIESSDTVNELLNRALPSNHSQTSESLITNTILIMQTLLEPRKSSTTIFSIMEDTVISELDEDDKENDDSKVTEKSNGGSSEDMERITDCIMSRLRGFFDILSNPPKQRFNPMPSTIGVLRPPLGPSRLAIVRFFNALLALRKTRVEQKMVEIEVPSKLLFLFFEFPWNNFLHAEVEKFFYHAINSTSTPNALLSTLLNECCFIERVSYELNKYFKTSTEENEACLEGEKRPGYLGHLASMASLLAGKFHSSQDLLWGLKPEKQTRWCEFASSTLEEIIKISNTDLGVGIGAGQGHLSSSEEEDDDDFRSLLPNGDLQRAFNNYQAQLLTTDFPDGFGFTEDDFNEAEEPIGSPFKDRISSLDFNLEAVEDSPVAAASFHQACQDRIQQFDQSNSEEEEEEEWPVLRKQVPRLNLLAAMEKEAELSNDKDHARSSVQVGSGVTGQSVDRDDEEDDYDDYRNEFDDSEDDLDSPAVIRQKKETDDEVTNEDDDDYESLHNSSLLNSSFVGDEAPGEEARVNGTSHNEDEALTATVGDSSMLLGCVTAKSNRATGSGDAGSTVDAEAEMV